MSHAEFQPVRVAIVGAGRPNIATSCHIPACRSSSLVDIVALCDRLDGVRDYAAECGADAYTDYEAMLARDDIEMVQVTTPDWCHCTHAELALAAGKHVLLQKPPCVSLDELTRLRHAAANSACLLKVSLNNRERCLCRSLKHHLDAGVIGQLRHVRISSRGRRYPIRNPSSPYLTSALGGVWMHNGLHWLDEAFFYAGARPRSVQVLSARNSDGAPEVLGDGPNYWCGMFELGASVTFCLEYNTMLTHDGLPGGMQRSLIGTEGELRQCYGDESIMASRNDEAQPIQLPLLAEDVSSADDAVESFRRLIDDFAAQIRDGSEREPHVSDSLALMAALLRGAAHAENGERIALEG